MFELQFLRPYWFLGLLPVIWLIWRIWRIKTKQGAWHQVIAPQFRSLLLGDNPSGEGNVFSQIVIIGLAFLWLIMLLALAGPTFKSVQMPAEKSQQGSVIVLDLSLSMLADDIQPNRLSRLKFKVTDLLKQNPEMPMGLVVYSGSAHTIAPISEDNQTLLGLLPALNPMIMPNYGSDPLAAFKQAKVLFEGSHISRGHIIWISDDLEEDQQTVLADWINAHDYSVSILALGTATGGAVQVPDHGLLKDDEGKIILPTLPLARFEALSTQSNAKLTTLTIDDSDLKQLLPSAIAGNVATDSEQASALEKTIRHPLDEGSALLLVLIPLAAFIFRRGWIFSISLVWLMPYGLLGVLGLSAPSHSYAAEPSLSDFSAVFQSPNQQGYKAWQADNFEAAAALFEDPQWRASALYRLGRYDEAAKLYALDPSVQGHYNRGNALARSAQLEAAKQAYEAALKLDANHAGAQANLSIVEQLLQKQQQNAQQSMQQESPAGQPKATDNSSHSPTQTDQAQQPPAQSNSAEQTQPPKPEKQPEQPGQSDSQGAIKGGTGDTEDNQSGKTSQTGETAQNSNGQSANQTQNGSQSATDPTTNAAQPANQTTQAETGTLEQKTSKDPQTSAQNKQAGLVDEANDNQTAHSQSGSQNDHLGNGMVEGTPADGELTAENKQQEQQRANETWLKQIPDQPGLFLQRKFDFQYQQQIQNDNQPPSSQKRW